MTEPRRFDAILASTRRAARSAWAGEVLHEALLAIANRCPRGLTADFTNSRRPWVPGDVSMCLRACTACTRGRTAPVRSVKHERARPCRREAHAASR